MSLHYRYQYYASLGFMAVGLLLLAIKSPLIPIVIPVFLLLWFVSNVYYYLTEKKKVEEGTVFLMPIRAERSTRLNGIILLALAAYMFMKNQAMILTGGLDTVLFLFVVLFAAHSLLFGHQASALRIFNDGVIYSRIGQFLPWSKIEGYTVESERFSIVFHLENMKTVTMRLEYSFFKKNLEQVEAELQKHINKR